MKSACGVASASWRLLEKLFEVSASPAIPSQQLINNQFVNSVPIVSQ